MNIRLVLIQTVYRIIFGSGIAALIWVGGHLLYAKTYPSYAVSAFQNSPRVAGNLGDIRFLSSPPIRNGHVMGNADIPESGISEMVLEGVEDDSLDFTAAHHDGFFRDLRNVRVGDTIRFSTRRGTYRYFVTTTEIVDPSETRVLESTDGSELTLITRYPFSFVGAAPQRFIVHARPHPALKD